MIFAVGVVCCSNLDPIRRWKVHSGQGKFNIMFKHKELLNMAHVEYIGFRKTVWYPGFKKHTQRKTNLEGGSSTSLEITSHWRRCRRPYQMAEKFAVNQRQSQSAEPELV